MTPSAETPPTPEEQLLQQLKPALLEMLASDVDAESAPEKIYQYNLAQRNYLMFRGMQFVAPVMRDGVSSYAPIGSSYGAFGAGGDDDGAYDYTRNIFRGYGNKFIAVLGQRAPNVIALADDPNDDKSVRACRTANECNAILNSWWDVDVKNIEVATYSWITGPAYLYTPWNADGLMYGFREEPTYSVEQKPMGEPGYRCIQCGAISPQPGKCQQCGAPLGPDSLVEPEMADVPVQSGVQKYANGRVECYVLDCTMITTPFFIKSDLRFCPWLEYKYEENRQTLISLYPKLREKGDDFGTPNTGVAGDRGRQVRDSIISPTGAPMRTTARNRWAFARTWIQANQFSGVKNEGIRKVLEENFPDGIKITRINGEIMQIENERLDHVWAAIQPSASATLNADPVGQDLVSAQLLTNHTLNIAAETIERGNPLTFVDPRVVNLTAWNKQKSRPNQVIPTLAAVGATLADAFYQTQPSRFSEQMEPWMAALEAGAVQDVGTQPQIFGGGNASTAREAEINKNAAMMQLGIIWTFIRKGWERAKMNGVRQLIKYGPAEIREGRNRADLDELTAGAWHFEANEAIPTTWGQRRDFLMFMLGQPEQVQQSWGITRPENIASNKQLMGMEGWYTPGLDDADKVHDTIQKLLLAAPIEQQQPDGSMQLMPSIPADTFEDNPETVVQLIQGWAQKASLTGGIRDTMPDAYANVIAYGMQYKKMLEPPAPGPTPITPKISVSVSSKDLAANQTQAILEGANLQVPPPQPIGMMPQQQPEQGAAPPMLQ